MQLQHNKETYEIDLDKNDKSYSLKINGDDTGIDLNELRESVFRVNIGGKIVNTYAVADREQIFVSLEGHSFVFDKPQEDEKSYGDSAADANREEIRTPMPGSVVKVLVEPGQEVEEGDGLIIVEAMKMESTLYSSISGKVSEVNAKAGEQVDSDLVLVLVEKE